MRRIDRLGICAGAGNTALMDHECSSPSRSICRYPGLHLLQSSQRRGIRQLIRHMHPQSLYSPSYPFTSRYSVAISLTVISHLRCNAHQLYLHRFPYRRTPNSLSIDRIVLTNQVYCVSTSYLVQRTTRHSGISAIYYDH